MRVSIITAALILILANSAFSDIIYFKDGGEVEGIVKEESEDYFIIDMGFGTMSVRKDEVDYIRKATSQELDRLKKKKVGYEIERGEWAPAEYEHIRILYRNVRGNRGTLQEARKKSQAIKTKVFQKEKRLSALLDALDKKGKKLKSVDAEKNVKKYNEIIAEMNSINADLNKENNNVKTLYEEEKKTNAKLAKLASGYRVDFQFFKDALDKQRGGINEDEITPDELYFFEVMDSKAGEMEGDFKRDVALYTPEGNQIIIDALIEGKVSARLMVDTGASIVLISNNVASRLGVKYEDIHTQIEIMVADGSLVKAKLIALKSVKVGSAEVKNVQAAILDSEAIGGVDGLLGMSFLSHFIMSVDTAGNKLILEKVL